MIQASELFLSISSMHHPNSHLDLVHDEDDEDEEEDDEDEKNHVKSGEMTMMIMTR